MITPELIAYIRAEFAKGKTRDELHKILVSDGGWSEVDMNEAFRTVLPMQNSAPMQSPAPSPVTITSSPISHIKSYQPSISSSSASSPSFFISHAKGILIFVIICALLGGVWYFFNPQIAKLWNSVGNSLSGLFASNTDDNSSTDNVAVAPVVPQKVTPQIKNCGTSNAPDRKNLAKIDSDAVLNCLGSSAIFCENSKAVLNDPFFPTIFEVVKNQDTCNFKLSYSLDSTLSDDTGKKLAGQYISCPISIVKAIDETKKVAVFKAPSVDKPNIYASQIYFYGTLGVFLENNLDQNKIDALGCSGPYIQSVIESYRAMQSKT